MSRGEENDEPITGDDHFAVVISGDGSAAIDGEPVRMAEGQSSDTAILDALHERARSRDTPVTATIADPSAAYVAHIEVFPDGSSRLLEQREVPSAAAPGEIEFDLDDGPDGNDDDSGTADSQDADPEHGVHVNAPGVEGEFEGEAHDDEGYESEKYDSSKYESEGYENEELDGDDLRAGGFRDDDVDEASYTLPEPPPLRAPDTGRDHEDDADHPFAEDLDRDGDRDRNGDREPDLDHEPDPAPEFSTPPDVRRTPPPALIRRLDRRNASRQSDDEYEPAGLLQRPLVIAPAALGVAGIVVVSLVMLGSGGSGDDPQQASARASDRTSESPAKDTPAPTFSVSVSSPSSSPSASKSKKAKKSDKPSEAAKPPAPVRTVTATPRGGVATVTQKPAVETAATAVKRLAKSDPSGRHICYRAYVSGQGWQKPVCDGTLAGTTGQNRPIKALNIASYGVDGSAANAVRHDPGSTNGEGRWAPSWTAVTGDSKNIYIGDTSAKYITGLAINTGSGKICPNARVRGYDWGNQGCADPRPAFAFAGSMENGRWLEAVKFTV
ncbi:hypothetical protein [Streptomyces sp. NPDC088789]|uniref:hypothetical protein n=1 Tax=Streptomyces sp. NPDC088789 TaxID=3365899 RepID=UPI0038170A06